MPASDLEEGLSVRRIDEERSGVKCLSHGYSRDLIEICSRCRAD